MALARGRQIDENWRFTEMLPNMTVVLRIFLTMSISVASCECSFSKLKSVKTYQRSNMSDARLSDLAVLSTERELAEILNFHHVIKDFASRKARKVHMQMTMYCRNGCSDSCLISFPT